MSMMNRVYGPPRARFARSRRPFGLTARFAMKANPHKAILKIFDSEGLGFDASSLPEVTRATRAGISPEKILLTSQQVPAEDELRALVASGARYTAASLHQLETFGRACPGATVSVRVNPGAGVGTIKRTQTGGGDSSFGIWVEYIGAIHDAAAKHRLTIERVHTHIGTGGDPRTWARIAAESIALLEQFPTVGIINLGGGFAVARMREEQGGAANLSEIGARIAGELRRFHAETGREIRLELEPGTYLTALAGALIARIEDIVDTGRGGYSFVKLDTGMNDILRPGMYGAQHPIIVVPETKDTGEYVFVGHNCETGDILTPRRGDPETVAPRATSAPCIGGHAVIEGAGAYCAAMSAAEYNSFPAAAAVLRREDGSVEPISRRGTLDDLLAREL
jgi:diaminopimelate decarboxylase